MSRRPLRAGTVLLLVAAVPAQEVSLACQVAGKAITTLHAFAPSGIGAPGGMVFVRADVHNSDAQAHDCVVRYSSSRWRGGELRIEQAVRLGPQERAHLFLPVPTPLYGGSLELAVEGTSVFAGLGANRESSAVMLASLSRPAVEPEALASVRGLPSGYKDPTRLATCAIGDLPADWRLYTGFDGVLLDGRVPLAAEVQDALRRYVFAGGRVLLGHGDQLPAGALRALLVKGGDRRIDHGLGSVFAVDRFGAGDTLQRLADGQPPLGSGPLPAVDALQQAQAIPGLGVANVAVFLATSLLFALAVGPVNFLWVRRRRRPLLLLLTIPVLGFGTTAVILVYGFLHDGIGVRGTVTSWTCLDQERREAVAFTARTLFAGLSPDDLVVGNDSLLLAARAMQSRDRLDRWHFDVATQRLDGSVLPARTATPLLTVQNGIARQRLAVRCQGDRATLLTDGGVRPVGPAILCDRTGTCWIGDGESLRKATREQIDAAAREFDGRAGVLQPAVVVQRGPYGDEANYGPQSIGSLAMRVLTPLRPGEYLVTVAAADWLDEHGLRIHYDQALHVVRGVLAEEDCLR